MDPEDFTGGGSSDGGDFGGGPPEQPPPMEPWTTSDAQRLDRLNAGLSGLQNELDEGTLTPEEFDPLYQRVSGMRAPLIQKQQVTNQRAQQEQQMQMLQGNAQVQAMRQQDATFDAQTFGNRMYRHVDERTGAEATLYQSEPGKWVQLDQGEGEEESLADRFAAALGGGSEEGSEEGSEGGSLMGADALDVTADRVDSAGPKPEVRPARANPDGTHTMDIYNGPHLTTVTFDRNGKTVNVQGDWRGIAGGRPPQDQRGQDDAILGLDQKTRAQAAAIARETYAHLPNGPRKEFLIAQDTSRIMQRIAINNLAEKQAGQREVAAQKKVQAQADTRNQVEYRHHFDDIQRQIDKIRKGYHVGDKVLHGEDAIQAFAKDPANENQSYIWDADAHAAEARTRAERATLDKFPEWTPGGKKGDQGGQAESSGQKAEPKKPQTAKEMTTPKIPAGYDPIPMSGQKLDPAKSGKSAEAHTQFKSMGNKAALAGDWEGQKAANELAAIVASYGHINAVPERKRAEIMKLVERVQKYR